MKKARQCEEMQAILNPIVSNIWQKNKNDSATIQKQIAAIDNPS